MQQAVLKQKDVVEFLDSIPETQIFTLVFLKKDETLRRMLCRRGVKKHLKTDKPSTMAHLSHMKVVYDMEAADYRAFDMRKVIWIKSGTELGIRPTNMKVFDSKGLQVKLD